MTRCNTMEEVRAEVDRLDREIVRLLAEREQRIADAGRIKPTRSIVRDEDRIEDVVTKVRRESQAQGANADLIEAIYRDMMERFIAHEFKLWDAHREP
ncbi:chorismate mutase [Zavarzinia compransoris]|uniref:chorismate mutase n=1 Tax=Zavarzinia marina TaxID=2911065 RepID=UPI001F2DA53A|nr:chorismate mutase [Zavarzinia marina]MCF4164702.1 chorismate mutase [Zavarzinia marina]